MNKKIFTLLAVACVLFMAAYHVNARIVSDRCIGTLVKSLPEGLSKGMYHIQVDSICLRDQGDLELKWFPVTYDGGPGTQNSGGVTGLFLHFNGSGNTLSYALSDVTPAGNPALQDTIVLAVTEQGQVVMISAKDLRNNLAFNGKPARANLADLQAAMWCIEVEDPAVPQWGNWPTFHFTNKIFDLDLDFTEGMTYVNDLDRGWMFSASHENNQLFNKMPFFRNDDPGSGNYLVLATNFVAGGGLAASAHSQLNLDGRLTSRKVTVEEFASNLVPGMLKLSIVTVAPVVLTAEDFNTKLGNTKDGKPIQLSYSPKTTIDNPFNHYLRAFESENVADYGKARTINPSAPSANELGYLNVAVYSDENGTDFEGYIANMNADDPDQYENDNATQWLNFFAVKATKKEREVDTDDDDFNYSYRFVYFPSQDSLVINAYYVKHNGHNKFTDGWFVDAGNYDFDPPGTPYFPGPPPIPAVPYAPYYYGLYNDDIHLGLIVRYQDLSGSNGASMLTIREHWDNVRFFFDINSCAQMWLDVWRPSPGVYTIWDQRGLALGIKMYNGTYTPQWIKLEDDIECPDRIPSYQWVVEYAQGGRSQSRVTITSREFGDFTIYAPAFASEIVQMKNVLIKKGYSKIFASQSQFVYGPLVPDASYPGYEPITFALVKGAYLTPLIDANGADAPTECGTGGMPDYSGFRPVINAYLGQETLGYKHFNVGKNPLWPDYGKSEDVGNEKGMDFNAFTFNYYAPKLDPTHNTYIHLGERYDEQLLKIEKDAKTPFQFMIGQELRYNSYKEEVYGYPLSVWTDLEITEFGSSKVLYVQHKVPRLIRYYYELKVADYYTYRDGLAQQFVVLKGAERDHSSINNAMIYGLANVWALREPFKFANVYLRETYFPKMDRKPGAFEERNKADDTRRIYYAILDRIELEQVDLITELGPYEISDVLYVGDGSTPYSLVGWDGDFTNQWVKARGKVASTINIATFALEYFNYDLYRRLRSTEHDTANPLGDGMDPELGAQLGTNLDAPKTLRIWATSNNFNFLYEDAMSAMSQNRFDTGGKQINFLGQNSINQYPEKYAPDGTVKYNYNLFIDTAYINRGTGPIKPQYLIAVGQQVVTERYVYGFDNCDNLINVPLQPYIIGRYLVNATDSARAPGSNGDSTAPQRTNESGKDFLWDTNWDRLCFVPAVHIHDRLYIISEVDKRLISLGIDPAIYWVRDVEDNELYINGEVLFDMTLPGGALYNTQRCWDISDMLGTYYDFEDWDNYHNDVCFSLRFTHPGVVNPDENGDDVCSNYDKRFYIESETNDRTPYGNPKIAPVQGGWIKIQNLVPVLSRSSYGDPIQQGEIFNIAEPPVTDWQDGVATQNERVSSVSVVAGDGFVTIFNADGKQVKIANMLGQTLTNKVLTGNKQAVSVPAGIAVVTVEGEKAVKVIIK